MNKTLYSIIRYKIYLDILNRLGVHGSQCDRDTDRQTDRQTEWPLATVRSNRRALTSIKESEPIDRQTTEISMI